MMYQMETFRQIGFSIALFSFLGFVMWLLFARHRRLTTIGIAWIILCIAGLFLALMAHG